MATDIDFGIENYQDEAVLEILHPATGQPMKNKRGVPVTITLCGVDSEHHRKAKRRVADENVKRFKGRQAAAIDVDNVGRELVAMCVTKWTGFDYNGDPAEPTLENVLTVFKARPFVFEQSESFMLDRKNYYLD